MMRDGRCDRCSPEAPAPEVLFVQRIPGSDPPAYVALCRTHFERQEETA